MQKKTHYYPKVDSSPNMSQIEKRTLAFWENNNIFQKSIDKNYNKDEFIFYDGPPFANGLPHYGHLLTGFIKDTYARYQTMKGNKVERRFGWDCHGLPAEMATEKDLGISGRSEIVKFGIDKFNDQCKKSVMKYENLWQEYVNRQGRWVDFENSYKTMDKNFMESVIWAFAELYKKGLIYEAMKVMPYSWACQTPLSNFETRLDNSYRERADKAVTVSFLLNEKPKSAPSGFAEYRILAWTTTPWTLPSNLALAIGLDIEYVYVPCESICFIIARFALEKYKNVLGHCKKTPQSLHVNPKNTLENMDCHASLAVARNDELKGLIYKPLFNYFSNQPNAFKILVGDFVTEGDGTGIVHIAPGFGEDDQILCEKNNIDLVCPVDNAGKFTKEIGDFEGLLVFDANDKIIIKLKEQGNWIKTEQILHNYPHCWRTDTPLIYKAVPSWYVKVTAFKDRMCELNKEINWIPEHVKDGLFGKWLENAKDWAISRNRFWGSPIPIWRSDDPTYPRIDVYGSIEELERDFNVKIEDLHRPYIDRLTRSNPDDPTGKSIMRRVEDVFDCWFESGSMPYAQVHYPFENKNWFENHFPADFIVEYTAQTRGWFYTLMVLSTALFDRPPFLNCICHGVILDSSGQKLSKRLNNYADPLEIFDLYGSDTLRALMLAAGVVKGSELLIDKDNKMVYESLRLMVKPIWNSFNFFTLYANADGIKASLVDKQTTISNKLDSYILIKLKDAVDEIDRGLNIFDTTISFQAINNFFEPLNNWYIRRSRNRFWKSAHDDDKKLAYDVLYTCLVVISKAMAPLLPFLSEEIFKSLTDVDNANSNLNSVHLQNFPDLSFIKDNDELIAKMDYILDICNAGLFVRNAQNIRTRQPLASITIINNELFNLKDYEELILDEINLKEIKYAQDLEKYAERKLSLNFPIIGKRLPSKVKDIINANKKNSWYQEDNKLTIAGEILNPDEFKIILSPINNFKGAKALSNHNGIIILDLDIIDELYEEGIARDLVRFIQQARKDAGLEITDRILLKITNSDISTNIIKHYQKFIEEQTLSHLTDKIEKDFYVSKIKLESYEFEIKISKYCSS